MKDIVFDAVVYVGNETDVEFAIAQSEILKENNKRENCQKNVKGKYIQCVPKRLPFQIQISALIKTLIVVL